MGMKEFINKIVILPEKVARAMGNNIISNQNEINKSRNDIFCYVKNDGSIGQIRYKYFEEVNRSKIGYKLAFKLPDNYEQIFLERGIDFVRKKCKLHSQAPVQYVEREVVDGFFINKEMTNFGFDIEWEKVNLKENGKYETWLVSTHSVVLGHSDIFNFFANKIAFKDNSLLFIPYYLLINTPIEYNEKIKEIAFKVFNNLNLIKSIDMKTFFKVIPHVRGMMLEAINESEGFSFSEYAYEFLDIARKKIQNELNKVKFQDIRLMQKCFFILCLLEDSTLSYKEKSLYNDWVNEKILGDRLGLYGYPDDNDFNEGEM